MESIVKSLSKRGGITVGCCAFVIALILSILTIISPKPQNKEHWFSAERANKHIEVIAQKQHSVFDEDEIEEVRNYLQEAIGAFDNVVWERVKHNQIEVLNQKTRAKEWIDIDNIYAEIPGVSGAYMVLMAHYDSSPYKEKYGIGTEGSYGAADDGYGLATMLEIMRLLNDYAAKNRLINGVKFVFTDAEEVALGGSTALVTEYAPWLQGMNIVINMEARGNKGPLYMFQTSDKNYKLIDFYSRTHLPFSFSIAADVYKYLPNDTDFTPFLDKGYAGLNFATLNSLKYYHTPNDNLDNADLATLQFYGEQVYPLVMKYVASEQYSAPESFLSGHNAVFFPLLPGFLLFYSQTLSWVLIAIATFGAALIAYFALRKRAISGKKTLLAFGIWTGFIFAAAVAGLLLAKFIGFVTGNAFILTYMPNVPFDFGFTLLFAALVLVAGFFVIKLCKRLKCAYTDTFGGAVLLILLLNLIFAFLLHGGTYLFVWPALFMLAIPALSLCNPSPKCCSIASAHLLNALTIVVTSILYMTIVYSLFLALTFGALAIILLFTAIYAVVIWNALPTDVQNA